MVPLQEYEALCDCRGGASAWAGKATSLTDHKMWCLNGKCYYTWVCKMIVKGGNSAHVMIYDMDWNAHPEFSVFNSIWKVIIPA